MRTFRWFTSGAAVVGVAAALLVPTAPAGAAAHCTAYGSLPARVSIHSDHVVVHTVLRGSSGCHGEMTDNGASATLYPPKGTAEDMRWRHFGSSETVDLYVTLTKDGRYTLRGGDVQVYDNQYRHVDSTWRTSTMTVKRAGRIRQASAGGSHVFGRAQFYSKFGWTGYDKATVLVQRRAVGSATWHTLGSARPDSDGAISYRTAISSHHVYRLAFRSGSAVWGARSRQMRG